MPLMGVERLFKFRICRRLEWIFFLGVFTLAVAQDQCAAAVSGNLYNRFLDFRGITFDASASGSTPVYLQDIAFRQMADSRSCRFLSVYAAEPNVTVRESPFVVNYTLLHTVVVPPFIPIYPSEEEEEEGPDPVTVLHPLGLNLNLTLLPGEKRGILLHSPGDDRHVMFQLSQPAHREDLLANTTTNETDGIALFLGHGVARHIISGELVFLGEACYSNTPRAYSRDQCIQAHPFIRETEYVSGVSFDVVAGNDPVLVRDVTLFAPECAAPDAENDADGLVTDSTVFEVYRTIGKQTAAEANSSLDLWRLVGTFTPVVRGTSVGGPRLRLDVSVNAGEAHGFMIKTASNEKLLRVVVSDGPEAILGSSSGASIRAGYELSLSPLFGGPADFAGTVCITVLDPFPTPTVSPTPFPTVPPTPSPTPGLIINRPLTPTPTNSSTSVLADAQALVSAVPTWGFGVAGGAFVLLLGVSVACCVYFRRKRRRQSAYHDASSKTVDAGDDELEAVPERCASKSYIHSR